MDEEQLSKEEIEERLDRAQEECRRRGNDEASPIFLLFKEMCAEGKCPVGKTEYAKLDPQDRAVEIANGRGFRSINDMCHHGDLEKCYGALIDYLSHMKKKKVKVEILKAIEAAMNAAYFMEALRKEAKKRGVKIIKAV